MAVQFGQEYGKTYFLASRSLDQLSQEKNYLSRVGHVLEIVTLHNPYSVIVPENQIGVQVFFKGMPLPGTHVAFIPRDEVLRENVDQRFESKTNDQGIASVSLSSNNQILIATRLALNDEQGDGYDATSYSATLTLRIPEVGEDLQE